MNWKHYIAVLVAIVVVNSTRTNAQVETYELNHVHATASVFMDTDEMHPVTLQILPDALRISTPYSFKSQDGSRTLHCSLPSSIILDNHFR